MFSRLPVLFLAACVAAAPGAGLEGDVQQLVVGIAADGEAPDGRLQGFERTSRGWRAATPAVRVLFGRRGLAWGRGALGTDEAGLRKAEGDGRAPAGVFSIGTIYGYDAQAPVGVTLAYHQVTAADAWIDDPAHPDYNRHVVIDPRDPPPWFEKQRMRLGDPAYRWLVEIRHNADPPVPGAGSAIFFHVRRGPDRPGTGCTTMAEEDLLQLMRWLRPERRPHYVLLPWRDYLRLWQPWGLPSADGVRDIAP